MYHIVLVEPEIPQNAGNIARTCAATGTHLHMIRPLGFEVTDKYLKRAGLDYWHLVDISYYDSFEELQAKYPTARFFFLLPRADIVTVTLPFRRETSLSLERKRRGFPRSF